MTCFGMLLALPNPATAGSAGSAESRGSEAGGEIPVVFFFLANNSGLPFDFELKGVPIVSF